MLSIGAFSKLSKVTTKTLRYYDEIGLIKPIHVNSENGYRYYDVEQLETILLINKLKRYCFTLDEISEVLNSQYDDHLLYSLAKQKRYDIKEKLDTYNYILNQLDNDILNLERGIHIMAYLDDIQIKLIETQTQNILFIREMMSTNDTSINIGKMFERVAKEKLTMTGNPMTIFHHIEGEFDLQNYDNEVAIPIRESVDGTRELKGSLCASATLNGPYSELASIYAKLNQWIKEEGYTVNSEAYEVYVSDPSKVKPEENITEIYVPIKR